MQPKEFDQLMQPMVDAFTAGNFSRSVHLAQVLKAHLISDETVDPLQIGWVRFYEFKSLYELKQYQEAFDLLNTPEEKHYVISTKNAAWMYSVGVELAMRLDLPEEVVAMGKKCLQLRLEGNFLDEAVLCAKTVCVLLQKMQRDDLNTDFATFLVHQGKKLQKPELVAEGETYLRAGRQ